jgi:hypothetical protein
VYLEIRPDTKTIRAYENETIINAPIMWNMLLLQRAATEQKGVRLN